MELGYKKKISFDLIINNNKFKTLFHIVFIKKGIFFFGK